MRLALCSLITSFGLIAAAAAVETVHIMPPLKPAAPPALAAPVTTEVPTTATVPEAEEPAALPAAAATSPNEVPATATGPAAAEPAAAAPAPVAASYAPPMKPAVPAGFAGTQLAALPTLPALPTPPANAVSGPGKLMLDAVVIVGAKPIYEPMLWTVSVPAKVKNQPDEIVATQTAATPQFQLPPGPYKVTAQYGDAKLTEEIDIVAGDNRRTFDLRAGTIRMELIPYRGAKPIDEPIDWVVYRYARGDVDESLRLAAVTAPNHTFILSDGHYIVQARYGDTVTDLVVPVPAGTNFRYTVNLYAGKVAVSAISHQTNRPYKKDVIWSIYRAKLGADGQRRLVATQVGPQSDFQLREGKYIVVGQAGDLLGELPFEIKAGKAERIKIVLKQPAPVAEPAAVTTPPAAEPATTEQPAPAAEEPAPVAEPAAVTTPPAAEPATTEQPAPAAEPTGTAPSAATSG